MFHQTRRSGVYHMIWQPFSQAGSSSGYNFLVICNRVGKRLILGVSNAGIAPCGTLLSTVQGIGGVALAIQADIPQGICMLLHSPTLKTRRCNLFCCTPGSPSHVPSVLPGFAPPKTADVSEAHSLPSGRRPRPRMALSLRPGRAAAPRRRWP